MAVIVNRRQTPQVSNQIATVQQMIAARDEERRREQVRNEKQLIEGLVQQQGGWSNFMAAGGEPLAARYFTNVLGYPLEGWDTVKASLDQGITPDEVMTALRKNIFTAPLGEEEPVPDGQGQQQGPPQTQPPRPQQQQQQQQPQQPPQNVPVPTGGPLRQIERPTINVQGDVRSRLDEVITTLTNQATNRAVVPALQPPTGTGFNQATMQRTYEDYAQAQRLAGEQPYNYNEFIQLLYQGQLADPNNRPQAGVTPPVGQQQPAGPVNQNTIGDTVATVGRNGTTQEVGVDDAAQPQLSQNIRNFQNQNDAMLGVANPVEQLMQNLQGQQATRTNAGVPSTQQSQLLPNQEGQTVDNTRLAREQQQQEIQQRQERIPTAELQRIGEAKRDIQGMISIGLQQNLPVFGDNRLLQTQVGILQQQESGQISKEQAQQAVTEAVKAVRNDIDQAFNTVAAGVPEPSPGRLRVADKQISNTIQDGVRRIFFQDLDMDRARRDKQYAKELYLGTQELRNLDPERYFALFPNELNRAMGIAELIDKNATSELKKQQAAMMAASAAVDRLKAQALMSEDPAVERMLAGLPMMMELLTAAPFMSSDAPEIKEARKVMTTEMINLFKQLGLSDVSATIKDNPNLLAGIAAWWSGNPATKVTFNYGNTEGGNAQPAPTTRTDAYNSMVSDLGY